MTTPDSEATASNQTRGWTLRQGALLSGPAEAVVLIGGILLAAYVFTPTASFDWMGDVEQFGILRHYSIALGCFLGIVFLWPVWEDTTNTVQRVGLGLLGLGLAVTGGANALGAVGIRAGDWAIIGILLLIPLAFLVYGGGDIYAGSRRRGVKSLVIGLAYIGDLGLLFAGYQLASYFLIFVLLSAWSVMMYLELQQSSFKREGGGARDGHRDAS